jgi:hypothetical protein
MQLRRQGIPPQKMISIHPRKSAPDFQRMIFLDVSHYNRAEKAGGEDRNFPQPPVNNNKIPLQAAPRFWLAKNA